MRIAILPTIIAMECVSTRAFTNPSSTFLRSSKILLYSTTESETDSAFSAFADSLDDDEIFDSDDDSETTWQESLEMLLDPSTPLAKRQILLSDLLNSNENIQEDVRTALQERKIDNLLTPTGKKLQDGTKAVARQITTDILPGIAAASKSGPPAVPEDLPNLVPKIGSRILDAVSNQARKQIETIQADLADPARIPARISKQTADFATEAKNVFLETPEGISGPDYTVVSSGEGYEIRDYDAYSVASTSMSKVGEQYSMDDLTKGGAAFNALAAYLFGANDEGKIMDMTTPVSITSVGEMRFYLKKNGVTAGFDSFPEPLSPEEGFNEQGVVRVVDVPAARLAVSKFTGFVTDGEVQRQKDALLSSLAIDGVEVDAPHGAVIPHIVFQYNPPYTIPIIRRNEIAIPVRSEDDIAVKDLESEWTVDEGDENIEAPSDVE